MARLLSITPSNPYQIKGRYGTLPFWGGGLSLLAAAPGVGKTSWMLRMSLESATAGIPTAFGCYEHTEEELRHRLAMQTEGAAAFDKAKTGNGLETPESIFAKAAELVLLALDDRYDTVRAIEDMLLRDYGFPENGFALIGVDYVQRIPVLNATGLVSDKLRAGEAAAALRNMARRHGWAIIAASAVDAAKFSGGGTLADLLGDERLPYETDRALFVTKIGQVLPCGCEALHVETQKDRTAKVAEYDLIFWGEKFYPMTVDEHEAVHGRG